MVHCNMPTWKMRVMTEICLELGYGVIDGVGGHTECLRDGICPELQDRGMPSENVVEKGAPYSSLTKEFAKFRS